MVPLIFVCAGGFGLEVAAYAEDVMRMGKERWMLRGFLDDSKAIGAKHAGYPVLGRTDIAVDPEALYVVAVGSPEGRRTLTEKLAAKGARFATIIHPQSYVAATAKIGEGSVIAPMAFVAPEVRIGKQCVLYAQATAGHECQIGDYCVLSAYAGVHGLAQLGNGVAMGSKSYVAAKIKIGDGLKIMPGEIISNDLLVAA